MKILIAITWIFRIVTVQILKTRKRASTESMEWPRVSSEKISMIIIRVFLNIYLETHNTIESIEGVRAPWGLLCKIINNKNSNFCIMHVEIQNSRKQLCVGRSNNGFVV